MLPGGPAGGASEPVIAAESHGGLGSSDADAELSFLACALTCTQRWGRRGRGEHAKGPNGFPIRFLRTGDGHGGPAGTV